MRLSKNHKSYFIILGLLIICFSTQAQKIENLIKLKNQSYNPVFSKLGKAYLAPSMQMENYWIWGSSAVKDNDGKYHIYTSRFPKSLPFHPGWMVASDIIHGISDTSQGPYQFVDVALPARGSQYWEVDKDPKAYSRTVEWENDDIQLQGQLERPFILFDENGQPAYMFFATMDGPGGFFNATKSWNMVIPFKKTR